MAFPVSGDLRLLTLLLERIYAGTRRARSLADGLDVEVRVVNAALDAGEWLGVLTWDGDIVLTPRGVRIAGSRKRRALWAEAVTEHPFFKAMWPVEPAKLLSATMAEEPSPPRARRQARALWRLSRPGRASPPALPRQVLLEFPAQPLPVRPALDLRAGLDDNPDVYTVLLRALLDHGEVAPSQLRAMLDRNGGERCGIGGYLAMAVRRGDARRLGDVLIVTPGAIQRRDLAESPVTVALSDPDFRVHMLAHLADRNPIIPRFRPWLLRLFGTASVSAGLTRVLFDRPLASVAVAGDAGPEIDPEPIAFLAAQERRNLAIAFPSSLRMLTTGLSGLNRALRVQAANAATPPTPVDRKLVVHGGLVRPGEAPPRAIADGISLRYRAVQNAPAISLLAALGLLDRRGRVRVRSQGADLGVEAGGRTVSFSLLVRTLAHSRGWFYLGGGLEWGELAELANVIGILTRVDSRAESRIESRVTLDEAFFHRLQTDPEHRGLYESLQPLAEALVARLRVGGGGD